VASKISKSLAAENDDERTAADSEIRDAAVFRTETMPIDDILVLDALRRPLNPANMDRLVKSIERDGQKTPIDVVRLTKGIHRGKCKVIAGAHRLAACERLGMTKVLVRILEPEQAVGWEEAENLFRHLPALDESIALVNYAEKRGLTTVPTAKGRQPHDKGYSRVADALGYDRKRVTEAYAHHALPDSIKSRVRLLKLDDNRKFLTKLSKIETIAGQSKFLDGMQSPSTNAENKGQLEASPEHAPASALTKTPLDTLFACWEKSSVKKVYDKQSKEVRQRFRASLEQ
jgi:ParB family transcriptional regulator, chromosome partitioning protein